MAGESPRPTARAIGTMWLLYVVVSIVGGMLTLDGPMSRDLAAAVSRITDQEPIYRAGLATTVFANALYLVLTACLCELFRPVNRSAALAAGFLGAAGCVVQIIAAFLQVAAITWQHTPPISAAFDREQINAAVLLSLTVYRQTFAISVALFGLFELLLGYLMFTSGFLPRPLGVLFLIGGAAWACAPWPGLAAIVRYVGLPVGGLAELATAAWLVVKGIDIEAWRKRLAADSLAYNRRARP